MLPDVPVFPKRDDFGAVLALPNKAELDCGLELAVFKSAGFVDPNRLLVLDCAVPLKGFAGTVDAGDCIKPVFIPPNRPEACWILFVSNSDAVGAPLPLPPAGGGPAGVVERFENEKPEPGLLGAGVDAPTAEDKADVPALPNMLLDAVVDPPPNMFIDCDGCPAFESAGLLGVENVENMLLVLLLVPPVGGLFPVLAPPSNENVGGFAPEVAGADPNRLVPEDDGVVPKRFP